MAHHFILLRLNPFVLRVDMAQSLCPFVQVCLSAEGAKNVSWPWLSPLQGWGSLTMTSTGKLVYIYIYIFFKCSVTRVARYDLPKNIMILVLRVVLRVLKCCIC